MNHRFDRGHATAYGAGRPKIASAIRTVSHRWCGRKLGLLGGSSVLARRPHLSSWAPHQTRERLLPDWDASPRSNLSCTNASMSLPALARLVWMAHCPSLRQVQMAKASARQTSILLRSKSGVAKPQSPTDRPPTKAHHPRVRARWLWKFCRPPRFVAEACKLGPSSRWNLIVEVDKKRRGVGSKSAVGKTVNCPKVVPTDSPVAKLMALNIAEVMGRCVVSYVAKLRPKLPGQPRPAKVKSECKPLPFGAADQACTKATAKEANVGTGPRVE